MQFDADLYCGKQSFTLIRAWPNWKHSITPFLVDLAFNIKYEILNVLILEIDKCIEFIKHTWFERFMIKYLNVFNKNGLYCNMLFRSFRNIGFPIRLNSTHFMDYNFSLFLSPTLWIFYSFTYNNPFPEKTKLRRERKDRK